MLISAPERVSRCKHQLKIVYLLMFIFGIFLVSLFSCQSLLKLVTANKRGGKMCEKF